MLGQRRRDWRASQVLGNYYLLFIPLTYQGLERLKGKEVRHRSKECNFGWLKTWANLSFLKLKNCVSSITAVSKQMNIIL